MERTKAEVREEMKSIIEIVTYLYKLIEVGWTMVTVVSRLGGEDHKREQNNRTRCTLAHGNIPDFI